MEEGMKIEIYDLKTEYRIEPMGIDAENPRFSWKIKSDGNGIWQTAYHIVVFDGEEILWDSGEVQSNQSQYVRYEGKKLSSRQYLTWQLSVKVKDKAAITTEVFAADAHFQMGLLTDTDWCGQWIEPEREVDRDIRKPAPYLRRSFQVDKPVKEAYIYQTAQGLYEFWINGREGTADRFKPGLTSYYYRLQYQMYDITNLIVQGENVWAVMLGDGWWRGSTGGSVKNNFGYQLAFLGQLEIYYEDGSMECIATDEEFLTSTGGLLASDMLWGDEYDATKEPIDWKLPGYDAKAWERVHLQKHIPIKKLIASRSVPVREKEIFIGTPIRDSKGALVIDFGQNIAGYVKMILRDTKLGQKIHLVHGEDIDSQGCFSVENINQCSAPQPFFQETFYVCEGKEAEEYKPCFSVHGFRYLLVEGYDGNICAGDFSAYAVYSEMEETGEFVCSNELINKLVKNSHWSQKGNFLDVAVDCPTRERNAWTGDNQVYVQTACYFMNVYPFYEKWMQDQAIEQYESGKVGITFPSTSSVHNPEELEYVKQINPMFALAGPTGNGSIGEDCAGWGDAAAWIPYCIYRTYGDIQIIKNQYDTAKKWVDYMLTNAKEHNSFYENEPQYHTCTDGVLDAEYIYDTKIHYGEWQEPIESMKFSGDATEAFMRMMKEGKPLVATAYMARSAENVADMARELGKEADAEFYHNVSKKIKSVYAKYFIGDDGVIEPGHQAAYVRALAFDLCGEKREAVERQLVKEIEDNQYHLNTGFLSTPFLLPVLCSMGREDLAFRILEQTDYPSWLHPVLLGATTIPESWNSFDVHQASYNHYSYGAVCEFLFSYVAGIRPCSDKAGYQEFVLKPIYGGTLTHAKGTYESMYGTIVSEWVLENDGFHYSCVIPPNTCATLILPDGREEKLLSGYFETVVRM